MWSRSQSQDSRCMDRCVHRGWRMCSQCDYFNPLRPAPDSESGATEHVRLRQAQSGAETHFIRLVLKVVKLCIIMKEGGKPTSFSFSHVPQLEQGLLNFFIFYSFHNIIANTTHSGRFSWCVCRQEQWFWFWYGYCWFFIIFKQATVQNCLARYFGNKRVFWLFEAKDAVVTPQISFHHLSQTVER